MSVSTHFVVVIMIFIANANAYTFSPACNADGTNWCSTAPGLTYDRGSQLFKLTAPQTFSACAAECDNYNQVPFLGACEGIVFNDHSNLGPICYLKPNSPCDRTILNAPTNNFVIGYRC